MSDRIILAIETSGLTGSVALGNMERRFDARRLSADRRHTSELLPLVREMLDAAGLALADVAVFAYSAGPGSFTGLRVAATVARMIQSAVGCRVVAASTLEVVARNALAAGCPPPRIVAMLDARRGQAFGATFEPRQGGELEPVVPPGIYEPARLLADTPPPFCIVGTGIAVHRAACEASAGQVLDEAFWTPAAEQVLHIARREASAGRFCPPEEIRPYYLRPPECEEVYEQRRAEARRRRR